MSTTKEKKLLVEIRGVMRLKHCSIHTVRTYCDWITRYVKYHQITSGEDLQGGEQKIEQFLTHLAVETNIAPSTQNQACPAILLLYRAGLRISLHDAGIQALRADKKLSWPVVLSKGEGF